MADKNEHGQGKDGGNLFPENGVPVFIPWNKEKEIVVVCDVCGHKNPEHTAICEMCSNYLK